MRWLLHGNLTPAVAEALTRHEQTILTMADAGLTAETSHEEVLEAARVKQLEILTNDAELANAPFALDLYFKHVLVYLQLPGEAVEQDDAIDRLFKRYKRLTSGRLYTVTENRVKIRQLPGSQM